MPGKLEMVSEARASRRAAVHSVACRCGVGAGSAPVGSLLLELSPAAILPASSALECVAAESGKQL